MFSQDLDANDELRFVKAAKLIIYLRYGSHDASPGQRIWHSLAGISRILGIPVREVRRSLPGENHPISPQKQRKKRRMEPFTPGQVEHLCSHAVLESWAALTLPQRVAKLRQLHPDQYHTEYQLRKLYKQHVIKLRPVGIKVAKTQKQLDRIVKEKILAFPQVIRRVDEEQEIIFVDEATFTHSQNNVLTWQAKNQKISVQKKQLGFPAVAVIAGINMEGEIVAYHLQEKSIRKEDIVTFLRKVFSRKRFDNVCIYWDNLRSHYSRETVEEIENYQGDVIYGPTYSSEFNCIERLWAYSKRIFRRRCLLEYDYKDHDGIRALVVQSMFDVPRESLAKNAQSCVKAMRQELARLGYEPKEQAKDISRSRTRHKAQQ